MKNTPPKRNKKLLYGLIGLVALLIVAAVAKSRSTPKGEEVTAEKVQRRTIREMVSASGKIFPETEVKISSDVSGEVVELYVKEGDSVTAGQLLAKIKPDEYQSLVEQGEASVSTARAQREISSSNVQSSNAQIEQLKADRQRASAQLDVAKKAFQRSEKLFKEGVISESEQETAQGNLKAAEAALAVADAALKAAESNFGSAREGVRVSEFGISSAAARLKELRTSLQKTNIVAPVSGIVSKLSIEKGEKVLGMMQMTGTEMMRIANFSSMEVQVDVSENDILKVALGDQTDIEVDAYLGRIFKGKVTEIANSASNVGALGAALNTDQVTNFVVKIRVDPNSYADLVQGKGRYPFRPGMSAAVDIFTNAADSTLSVPLIAVTAREDDADDKKKADKDDDDDDKAPAQAVSQPIGKSKIKEIVFVVVGDTVAVREVKTGIQDNDHIEVLSGLQEGETVVTGPYSAVAHKLKAGSRITVTDPEKKKKEKKGGVKVEID